MADTADTRTPAQIEADIARRRAVLAETLDEIGVRVHPKTIVGTRRPGSCRTWTTRWGAPMWASTVW